MPRELALIALSLVCLWLNETNMVEAENKYHTVYHSWDGPSVVCYLFLYLFICVPTTSCTWLSTFCTLQLSSTFYLSQDQSWCILSILLGWNWGRWGLKEYKWKGSFLGLFVGLFVPEYRRFLFYLGCSNPPSTIFFIPHRTLFQFFCPHLPSKLGRQPCWVACLLICVSGSSHSIISESHYT